MLASLMTSPALAAESAKTAKPREQTEVERLQLEQQRLLVELRNEIARFPPEPENEAELSADEKTHLARRRELLQLMAEIEKRIAADAVGRVRYISTGVKEQPYQGYFDRFQRRVAEAGTKDFPRVNGVSVYGELIVSVGIKPSGRIAGIEVHSSSSDTLRMHAIRLLKELEPFEPYGPEMGKLVDRVVITVPFSYRND
ncbi:MAG TPA: energy transducer TonB [Roseateles sp.]